MAEQLDAEYRTKRTAEIIPGVAHTVVAGEIEHLLREAEEAQKVLAERRLRLRAAVDQARDPTMFKQDPRVDEAGDFLNNLGLPDMEIDYTTHPISHAWAHFFNQLREDASVPVPE